MTKVFYIPQDDQFLLVHPSGLETVDQFLPFVELNSKVTDAMLPKQLDEAHHKYRLSLQTMEASPLFEDLGYL